MTRLLLLLLLLSGCQVSNTLESLETPSLTCEYSPDEGGQIQVSEGECWVVRGKDLRFTILGEDCSEARDCITASSGDIIVPMAPPFALGLQEVWTYLVPCQTLETACQ
jgi:hypothetical protein